MITGEREEMEAGILPLKRAGEPEDIAKAVAFLLSDDASYATGSTLVIDGGRLLVGGEGADRSAGATRASSTTTSPTWPRRWGRAEPPASARAWSQGSGISKCSSRILKRLLGAVPGPFLDEVELALVELQVRAVGVEHVAQDLFALVRLQLLDEAEGLLGQHQAVGRHAGDLAGPPGRPAAVTSASSTTSVKTSLSARVDAFTMSPVSSRRRACTGPSRWKNMWSEPRAGPSRRVPGMPTLVLARRR